MRWFRRTPSELEAAASRADEKYESLLARTRNGGDPYLAVRAAETYDRAERLRDRAEGRQSRGRSR